MSLLTDGACLNFLGLFGECVNIHCVHFLLVSAFTNETQASSSVIAIFVTLL
jgi:hypothetical protein